MKKTTTETRRATAAELTEEQRIGDAAEKIGEAFATFEEYAEYIPTEIYNDLAQAAANWVDLSQWMCKPSLVRDILPLLVAETITNKHKPATDGGTE